MRGLKRSHDDGSALITRADIDQWLASLLTPAEGYVRVYRGQSRDHGSLIPSAYRRDERDDRLLRIFVQQQASSLMKESEEQHGDLQSWFVWTRAIAQHYGVGSEFLDVTTDIDVALWFALHETRVVQGTGLWGAPGPPEPSTDYLLSYPFTKFEPNSTGQGTLYALDLPSWQRGKVGHGDLIDLATAPTAFTNLRMQAQCGGLVGADREQSSGDLTAFVVGQTSIAPSIEGSWQATEASDLFPDVTRDDWLRHFVSIPMVYTADQSDQLMLTLALPIELHLTSQEAFRAITDHFILLAAPLFAVRLRSAIDEKASWVLFDSMSSDVASILLAEPVFLMTPEIDSGLWNESILLDRLPTTALVIGSLAEEGGLIDLTKLFLEFSVLEYGLWTELESSGETYTICRGVYLERKDAEFLVWFFYQEIPSGPDRCIGPFEIAFDDEERCFKLKTNDGFSREALTDLVPLHKRFLVALTVMRDLSVAPIPLPFPSLSNEDGSVSLFLTQSGGKLVRAIDGRTGTKVYLHKRALKAVKIGMVSGTRQWAQLDASEMALET